MDPLFLHTLEKYVNGSCFSKADLVLSLFSKKGPYLRNAGRILNAPGKPAAEKRGARTQRISLQPYTGGNKHVRMMREFLKSEVENDLFDAVVHGSLATGEEIGYSDFDALVILKDDVLKDKDRLVNVAFKLGEARKIMFLMDPLQHHGWFVLTESMLKDLPLLYFPPVLFPYSRSILRDEAVEVEICFNESADFQKPFDGLVQSLLFKLQKDNPAVNAYTLKNLLSEFMLLPAFYVQARDRKGIFKGESFAAARVDFTGEEWDIMNRISRVRAGWHYPMRGWGRYFYKSTNPVVMLLMKKFDYRLDAENKLLSEEKSSMLAFTRMLAKQLNTHSSNTHSST